MDSLKTNNWEKNLCSIVNEHKESIERKFVNELLQNYFLKTGILYVSVYRPNYVIKDLHRRLEELVPSITLLQVEEDTSAIFFYFVGTKNLQAVIDLCVDLWFGFEESFLYFLFDEIKNLNLLTSGRVPWKDILGFYSGFIVFHYGMKDDIIWIGKSDKLLFLPLGLGAQE
jgi:hypothetical protein